MIRADVVRVGDLLEPPAAQTALDAPESFRLKDCAPWANALEALAAWAEPRGHALYWVDNRWLRARVRGRDLPGFFAEILQDARSLAPAIAADAEYLIEAEEY